MNSVPRRLVLNAFALILLIFSPLEAGFISDSEAGQTQDGISGFKNMFLDMDLANGERQIIYGASQTVPYDARFPGFTNSEAVNLGYTPKLNSFCTNGMRMMRVYVPPELLSFQVAEQYLPINAGIIGIFFVPTGKSGLTFTFPDILLSGTMTDEMWQEFWRGERVIYSEFHTAHSISWYNRISAVRFGAPIETGGWLYFIYSQFSKVVSQKEYDARYRMSHSVYYTFDTTFTLEDRADLLATIPNDDTEPPETPFTLNINYCDSYSSSSLSFSSSSAASSSTFSSTASSIASSASSAASSSASSETVPSIGCNVVFEEEFEPVGDESGKLVYTKKQIFADCEGATTVQGPCLAWEEESSEIQLPDAPDVALEYPKTCTNVGQVIAQMQATQLATKAMFSGIRGVCERGMTYNFDWLEDPAFWASAVMSAIGSGALGKSMSQFASGYSGCLLGGAMDLAAEGINQMLYEVNACDPVDEICDEEHNEQDPGEVISVTREEWDEMLMVEPELENAVEVIEMGPHFVIFRYFTLDELMGDTTNMDADALQQAQEEARQRRLQIKAVVIGVQVAACAGMEYFDSGDNVDNSGGGSLDGNAVDAVVGGSLGLLPFPYGTIAQAAWKMLNSFDIIDSCHSGDDAQGQGERHEIAYRGIKFDTCRLNFDECVFNNSLGVGSDCLRTRYTYCCYDSKLSMEMMIQMKAQLGKDWLHCTGITLAEFASVVWRQCSEAEMQNGPDGGEMRGKPGTYDMTESYQFQHRCMNMEGILNYIQSMIPGDLDDSRAMEMIRDLDVSSLE